MEITSTDYIAERCLDTQCKSRYICSEVFSNEQRIGGTFAFIRQRSIIEFH